VVTVLAAAGILLPLALRRAPAARRGVGYFVAIGLGFMLLEIALIQKMLLVIGSPTASAATVIAAVLVGAGTGSLLSRVRPLPERTWPWVPVAGGAAAAALVAALGGVGWAAAALPFGFRVVLGAILVFPAGAALGFALPEGMRRFQAAGPGAVAWAWGANGFASVAGAMAAPLVALHLGIQTLALAGVSCYLVAVLLRPGEPPPA
jgi:hypothetical protein